MLKKSLVSNESGNLIVVVAVMGMIAGLIGYWMSLSDKVVKEVRTLGSTQMTTFIRADFKNTIKKTLQGENENCASLTQDFETRFKNFQTTTDNARVTRTYTDNPSTPVNEISDETVNPEIKCFFNPTRYSTLGWTQVKVNINRTAKPNYFTLSNSLAADVLVTFKNNGKPSVLKYQFKYRVDVLSLDRFGLIFTKSKDGPKFDIGPDGKLKLDASVFFDLPTKTDYIPLTNLISLPFTGNLEFQKEASTTAVGFTSSPDVVTFLETKSLNNFFKRGIQINKLPKGVIFKSPYEISAYADQWDEMLDYSPIPHEAYALPSNPSSTINYNLSGDTFYFQYNNIDHNNTAAAFNLIKGPGNGQSRLGNEKFLFESCSKVPDLSTTIYPLYVFNDLGSDFTIDFTHNIDARYPPLFCGIIAAKNLIVKLNSQTARGTNFKHHFIGKLILSGKIKIENSGEFNIHDISTFTTDKYSYAVPQPLDIGNLQLQFFNHRYYSTQNFFLPFFKPGQTPDVQQSQLVLESNLDRFFVPRGTSAFFQQNCPAGRMVSRKCRIDPKGPTMDGGMLLMNRHWQKLLFEVYDVE